MPNRPSSTTGALDPATTVARVALRPARVRSSAVSLCAAGLVAAGVLATGPGGPLPAVLGAAAFLFLVVESDLRSLRIPNRLTLPALVAALLGQAVLGAGLAPALLGVAAACALLLPPYLAGALGGGDVKAVLPLAALWGVETLAVLLVWSAFLGGAVGLLRLAAAGALGDLAARWRDSLRASLLSGRPVYYAPRPGSAAASVLPFGLVIGVAAVATLRFGAVWA